MKALIIFMISVPSAKNQGFFGQNNTFTQRNSVRDGLEILNSIYSFCKIKGHY